MSAEPCLCGDPGCPRCFPNQPPQPSEELVKAADHLLDLSISRHGNGDEVFYECAVCGDWDGHQDWCFVGKLKSWMEAS